MPDTAQRQCPCCGQPFTPSRVTATTCSPACSKRAEHARVAGKRYEEGLVSPTLDSIALVIRLREMDQTIAAELQAREAAKLQTKAREAARIAQRELDSAMQTEAEEAAEREAERARRAEADVVDRQAAIGMREARERRYAAGWRPLGAAPSPFTGKATLLALSHLLRPAGPRPKAGLKHMEPTT